MHRMTKLAVLAAAIAAAPPTASARSSFLSTFNTKYGTANTVLDSCNLCHPSGTSSFNDYANDLRANGISTSANAAFTAVEPLDSDRDGFTNLAEIRALTFPGLASSFPVVTAPRIAVSPTSVSFGTVTVGASASQAVTVSNTGNASLTVSSVARCTGTSTEFSASPAGPFTVAAGARATVTVSYAPGAAGTDSGCFQIASNDGATGTVQVAVSGTGQTAVLAPRIAVSPTSLSFGTVTVGSSASQTTTVSNAGTADLLVSSVAPCTGTSAEFAASPTGPFTVAAGGSQTVTVAYAPTSAGTDAGCFQVASNDAATGTVSVAVSGAGQAVVAPVVDVDIGRFSVAKRVDLSRGGVVAPRISVVNAGTVAGTVTIEVEGAAGGAVVYTASQDVFVAAGATQRVPFPAFTPAAPGEITFTATVLDQDPDVDVATAVTRVVP